MEIVGRALFGFDPGKGEPPVWTAAVAIVAIGVLAAYAIWSRVRKAETAALGGG